MKKLLFFLLVGLCTLSYLYLSQPRVAISQDELIEAKSNVDIVQLRFSLAEIKDMIMQSAEQRDSYLLDSEKVQSYKSQME